MKKLLNFVCILILMVGAVGIANATMIDYVGNFTASNFVEHQYSTNIPPPDDPISGSFSFSVDDSLINTIGVTELFDHPITSISLAIDGVSYSTSTASMYLHFVNNVLNGAAIGGSISGVAGFFPESGNDDFVALWDPVFLSFNQLLYTTANQDTQWLAVNVDFDIRSVPEPATLALMGLGLAGLGFMKRRTA